MTWYAVHDDAGELVSLGTVLADPLPDGLQAVAVGEVQPQGAWNASTRAFEPASAAPAPLTRLQFLRRIPPAKRIAIRAAAASGDAILADAMALLDTAEDVSVTDPDTVALIGYCVQRELLTAAEAAEVLA